MANRLKEMGETASWRLMVRAAIKGAEKQGYALKRQPGRGLSNTYEVTRDGKTRIGSVRTTRDRWIAFPPLDNGARWKTLNDVDLVLVSAVDDPANPQNVHVYLFPADEVRKRFDASYAARMAQGHTVRDGYGMWVMLDKGDDAIPSQVGHSLALDYPAIDCLTLDELEASANSEAAPEVVPDESVVQEDEAAQHADETAMDTVADVLRFARQKIADLTSVPVEAIKLNVTMGFDL